jgi:hypothetical protein
VPPSPTSSRPRLLAWGAIVGQAAFTTAWLVDGWAESHGYSPGRHDVSDLGAITAHHAAPLLAAEGLSGVLVVAFVLGALAPSLAVRGRRVAVGIWLLALSLPALDDVGDVVLRLDCRAADAGCSATEATRSWHGTGHPAVFLVATVASVVAPFALARRMTLVEGWRAWAQPTRTYGLVLVVTLLVTAATAESDVGGWTQRASILLVGGGVVALAVHVLRTADARHRHDRTAMLSG